MTEIRSVITYKYFKMNNHKHEILLHNFFCSSCLNVDIFDALGNRHTPRKWFYCSLGHNRTSSSVDYFGRDCEV